MSPAAMEPWQAEPEVLADFLAACLARAGVSDRQIAAARAYHVDLEGRQPFSRSLVDIGLASDESVARWISDCLGWRYVPPGDLRVHAEAHRALPESIARSRCALVLSRTEDSIVVAVADPTTPQFAQVIHATEGLKVEWVVSPQADIAARLTECYAPSVGVRDNEIERLVEDMLREASHTRGVSDIHCIPGERSCDIRWRIDGELVPWRTVAGPIREAFVAQVKLSSTRGPDGRSRDPGASGGLDVANRLDAQDASATRDYGSRRVSLRYSSIPAVCGESIVIRILDQSAQVGTLESLGFLPDMSLGLRAELKRPNGMIVVSGPTGHGKSTTLAACVPCLDSQSRRVLSVEDPVEYRLRSVTQAPVSPRLSFASALRAFLRHNPDIVIVGEIRDAETAALAARLSLTGHLVLTTVHAGTAFQALARLLNLGVEAPILASTVRVLLGQRLVRRLCPGCKRAHRDASGLEAAHARMLGAMREAGWAPKGSFCEAGGGCPHCANTGYAGRIAIAEMRLVEATALEGLGRGAFDPSSAESAYERAAAQGRLAARTMRQDGILKAAVGETAVEEVHAVTCGFGEQSYEDIE